MARGSSKRSRKARDKFSLRYKGQVSASEDHSNSNCALLSDEIRDKYALCSFLYLFTGEKAVRDATKYLADLCSTCRGLPDQVLAGKKKQKVAADVGPSEPKDGRPVSKSEMRKLKQIERRKEAQARVQGSASSCAISVSKESFMLTVMCWICKIVVVQFVVASAGAMDSIQSSKLNDVAQKLLVSSSLRGGTLTAKQRLKREKAMYDAGLELSSDAMLFKHRGDVSGEKAQPANTGPQSLPDGPAPDRQGDDTTSQDSADDDMSPAQVGVDAPGVVPVPERAPPISVTFSKRHKVTPSQHENSGSAHEAACAPVVPLSEEQKQAVTQARKELEAAGEMTGAATTQTAHTRQLLLRMMSTVLLV